ncbi:wax ester/triacylglycerol synthase domain-containing protein [Streptomyces buecherae]|uniref:wax ester/triacylglycerol synthase domain-containing protein n=1 Tax=Streptomyces buecherae TaxID=2763006 RepID=UPI00379EB157
MSGMNVNGGHAIGPIDRAFLALARQHQPTTGFFLDFAGPVPDVDALAERVLGRAAGLPALNLLRPDGRARRWRPRTADFDPGTHVRRRTGLAEPGALADATNALLSHPLPGAEHPPWDLWLLDGAAERDGAAGGAGARDGFRLALRVHHAVQDGVGAAHSALALLGDAAAAGPPLYPARLPRPAGALLAASDAVRQLGGVRGWPALRAHPARRTVWTSQDVPLARLRQLADAWRTSVNDVCLTGLARAVRAWRRDGAPGACPDLPVLVAMSTRGPGQRYAPGNHVVGYRLVLPSAASRLGDAAARVRRQTDAVRRTGTRDARRLAVRAAPHRAGEWAMGYVKNAVPIGASSVTVADEELTCLGARLTGASMFYDVHDGLLGYVSFTRAGGVVRCGVVYDAALPRAADLARHWRQALCPDPAGAQVGMAEAAEAVGEAGGVGPGTPA